MNDYKNMLLNQVEQSQKLLIGIGEEFTEQDFEKSEIYKAYEAKLTGHEYEKLLLPFIKAYYFRKKKVSARLGQAYNKLTKLVEGKDYFVITLQKDDRIYASGLDMERIVAPCGSYSYMQCGSNCHNEIIESGEVVDCIAEEVMDPHKSLADIKLPVCQRCGQNMTLNLHPQDKYCEEGYLNQWQKYQKWLASTMNRQTVVLEAGVGFSLPNVVRWPFEKIAYLNHKAVLYRVHEEFWQLSDEVGEKGCSIQENSVNFLANL